MAWARHIPSKLCNIMFVATKVCMIFRKSVVLPTKCKTKRIRAISHTSQEP